MAGTVDVAKNGFYGMSMDGVTKYIEDIRTNCIEAAKDSLEDNMESVLFTAIRTGWTGTAEENFEENMKILIDQTQTALQNAQEALEQELSAIVSAWVAQDDQMVAKIGGK